MVRIISKSIKETFAIGKKLAKHLKPGDIVALVGIFGAGKTYFTKGIAWGLGVNRWREVNSPSFILGNVYQGKQYKLYHFDCQRLSFAEELLNLGFTDGVANGIIVVEWADKLPHLDKYPDLIQINFTVKGKTKRLLTFSGNKKIILR